ncbi:hypothetical protein VTN31DRAFT_6545 [Thermomyces dupontii]|uniref:uncharacterized protein n=1 Tax=Talaromyces thermophilus TaxID=28565 RepID=UPI0037424BEF
MPRSEEVMCHQCDNFFLKDEHGLICPRCGSEFTEIIEGSAEDDSPSPEPPSLFNTLFGFPQQSSSPRRSQSPPGDAIYRNPWTDEGDRHDHGPTVRHHEYRSPDGRVTFTSTTYTSGFQRRGAGSPQLDPNDALAQTVNALIQEITGASTARRRESPRPEESRETTPRSSFADMFFGGLPPRDTESPEPAHPVPNMSDILVDLLFDRVATQQQPLGRGGVHVIGGGGMDPFLIFSSLLRGGRHGDVVYSQEAFDRIISDLIEHNTGNGAPPASQSAIDALPKVKVTQGMLGPEGKAECSICMESVEVGSEVTQLPCLHWFHGQCIEMWLSQHNTCPHCRRPITADS